MIDKKPFRVTNEQARAEVICATNQHCSTCPMNKSNCDGIDGIKPDSFSDLLDSRELIDKQEAIIKEAVAIVDHARKYGIDNACSCDDCKKADSLLEKTKDYA